MKAVLQGILCSLALAANLSAAAPGKEMFSLSVTGRVVQLKLPISPHVEEFTVLGATNVSGPFHSVTGGVSGFRFSTDKKEGAEFFKVGISEVSSNELLTAIVLNRLAYGPTPDELDRLRRIGPEAFIQEQLEPEKIVEDPGLEEFRLLTNGWERLSYTVKAVGSELWLSTDDGGPFYLDDICLVKGSVANEGPNLIEDGNFENGLTPGAWDFGRHYPRSRIVTNLAHTGTNALLLQAEYTTELRGLARRKITADLQPGETYTLSLWHYRQTNRPNLFGIGLMLAGFVTPNDALSAETKLAYRMAWVGDLRERHVTRAIKARRQLLEILLQFFENHYVTWNAKNFEFMGNRHDGPNMTSWHATDLQYQDSERWRAALLKKECTFYDLLRISAESLSMILYLDTVSSEGRGIPNENYARELLELFTFGVDNGYDQEDIQAMARVWTGWRMNVVDPTNEFNPIAPRTTNVITEFDDPLIWYLPRHFIGVYTCGFFPEFHDDREKVLFAGKRVPARFGPPYEGRDYQLRIPARTGTNGVQDGYDVLRHIADQPFTQEFISVKLCRLFVHDEFAIGCDFTSTNLSAEGRLVRDCMRAWEENVPKGQIRKVLAVIFESELFRTKTAAFQKVKTPLEFTISAVRALRVKAPDGSYTAESDGFSLEAALDRMSHMTLFDREQPDGFPEGGRELVSVSDLVERIRWVEAYLTADGEIRNAEAGNTGADPVALLKLKLPTTAWTDAPQLADFFLGILYPGAGRANLDLLRQQAIEFLNTSDDGRSSSPFNLLTPASADYSVRVRALVAHLMSIYSFNEQ
jgi:uncharacterized protein (DUF1800 family)